MASSFGEDDVTIRFVVPSSKKTEDLCSEGMKQAFEVCLDHNMNPTWITEEDCLDFDPVKTDIFVFEEFTGQAFGLLKTCECLVVGPRCILDCVAANMLIPKGDHPLYNVAMRNLIITSTGFTEPLKSKIIEKIKYMGGLYCPEYRQSVTHLVAYHISSAKYEKALESGLPLMSERWVEAVWEESCKRNVCATDEEFQRFRCPVFHRMVVTCSQLPRSLKEKLRQLINNNGGEFSGELEAERTKVLVVAKPFGEKYKHALLWRIPCVTPAWVSASVARGHALPPAAFAPAPPLPPEGHGPATSTPERTVAQDLNFSTSMIQPSIRNIDETLNSTKTSVASVKPIESSLESTHLMMVRKMNLWEVKKAGPFLDGCNVYLSGFNPENSEKLRKIVNSAGATRFNEISDTVTHVIVGDIVPGELNMLQRQGTARPHVVGVQWLLESMRLGRPAPEAAFCRLKELALEARAAATPQRLTRPLASPLSKKGLLQLKVVEAASEAAGTPSSALKIGGEEDSPSEVRRVLDLGCSSTPCTPSQLPDTTDQSHQQQYSQQDDTTIFQGRMREKDVTAAETVDCPSPPERSRRAAAGASVRVQAPTSYPHVSNTLEPSGAENDAKQKDYFKGLTFSIAGYGSVNTRELALLIAEGGGRVATRRFKGVVDYCVVPLHGADTFHSAEEVVTYLWLEECSEEGYMVPLQYYHRPLMLPRDARPLRDCVVSVTIYSGAELRFISEVLQGLGAVHQAMMARVDRPGDDIRATTHLVAPDRPQELLESRKYKAACKWGVPCVTERWVLACAAAGRRLPHIDFPLSTHDLDVSVVDKTPLTHAGKRKLGEDTPLSKLELPGASPQAPTPSYLRDSLRPAATPESSPAQPPVSWATPRGPRDMSTPETPYGQVFVRNPSPGTRKMWKRWIDDWPEEPSRQPPPVPKRRNSTPIAELKRRIWHKFAIEPYEKSFGVKVEVDSHNSVESGDAWYAREVVAGEDPALLLSLTAAGRAMAMATAGCRTINRSPSAAVKGPSFAGCERSDPRCHSRRGAATPPDTVAQGFNTHLHELGHLLDSGRCVDGDGNSGGGRGGERQTPEGGETQQAPDGKGETQMTPEGGEKTQQTSEEGRGEMPLTPERGEEGEEQTPATGGGKQQTHAGGEGRRQQEPANQNDGPPVGSELLEWVDPALSGEQQRFVFMLTSIEERDKYEAIVRALGGVMSSLSAPDASVSHLVCDTATRNEKVLSSIAAGKWLLDKRFLEDSFRAGRFLDEEDYEWGNPRARYLAGAHAEGSLGAQLAAAAYRWRRRVQTTGHGAFHGMRAIVAASGEKALLYARLIVAGGGEVLPVRPPFTEPQNATICILELNKVSFPVDLDTLAAQGIPCVFPIYLNNFLINFPPPRVTDCLVPQFKQLLNIE